jgi:hypothetical protein
VDVVVFHAAAEEEESLGGGGGGGGVFLCCACHQYHRQGMEGAVAPILMMEIRKISKAQKIIAIVLQMIIHKLHIQSVSIRFFLLENSKTKEMGKQQQREDWKQVVVVVLLNLLLKEQLLTGRPKLQ